MCWSGWGSPVPAYEIDGLVPVVDPTAFVHPTAVLVAWKANGTRVYHQLTAPSRFGAAGAASGRSDAEPAVEQTRPSNSARA